MVPGPIIHQQVRTVSATGSIARLSVTVLMLLVVFCQSAFSQAYFHFTREHSSTTVAFKFYRNLIVIPVMLNGKGPFNFVLDTGVGVSTITDPSLKELLSLQEGKKLVIHGLGDQEGVDAYLSPRILVSAQAFQSLPMTLVVFREDPFFLSTYLGIKVHGILGYEFFNSFVVKINYVSKTLTLYAPNHFKPRKKFEAIPLTLRSNKPFVSAACVFNDTTNVNVDLLLDTGAGFPVSLESYSDPRLHVPDHHLETQLGLGLNGIIHGKLARLPGFQIGSFQFTQVVTSFPDFDDWETKTEPVKRNGSIGNFLLKRFIVVFDYANTTLYLKPNPHFDSPFEYDRTGIELIGGGEEYNHFIVFQVKANSPAANADIRPDDELVEINFTPVKNLDLGNIDHILSDPNAKAVMLKLRRGDDFLYVLLKMRDLI